MLLSNDFGQCKNKTIKYKKLMFNRSLFKPSIKPSSLVYYLAPLYPACPANIAWVSTFCSSICRSPQTPPQGFT